MNRLSGLEGAIRGVRWHHLEDGVKKELKEFYNAHK
jgi:DNA transformation protein